MLHFVVVIIIMVSTVLGQDMQAVEFAAHDYLIFKTFACKHGNVRTDRRLLYGHTLKFSFHKNKYGDESIEVFEVKPGVDDLKLCAVLKTVHKQIRPAYEATLYSYSADEFMRLFSSVRERVMDSPDETF